MTAEVFSILRLAWLTLKWMIFHRLVLLWRREYCGYIFTEPFSSLVLGVQWQNSPLFPALLWCFQLNENGIIAPCTSGVSAFWGELMFSYSLALRFLWWILQQCIFLLWHWKSSARNHCCSLHFAYFGDCDRLFRDNPMVILPFLTAVKSRGYAAINGGLPPLALCGRSWL